MSVNPPLAHDNSPVPLPEEVFAFVSDGVNLEIESGNGYPGSSTNIVDKKGYLYLSNFRMVYVPQQPKRSFTGVIFPYVGVYGEEFKQPVFGTNHLKGYVKDVPNGGLRGGHGKFKLTFTKGSTQQFSSLFFRYLAAARANYENQRRDQTPSTSVGVDMMQRPPETAPSEQKAYVDPEDPSRVYIIRPAEEEQGGGKLGPKPAEVKKADHKQQEEELDLPPSYEEAVGSSSNDNRQAPQVPVPPSFSENMNAPETYPSYVQQPSATPNGTGDANVFYQQWRK